MPAPPKQATGPLSGAEYADRRAAGACADLRECRSYERMALDAPVPGTSTAGLPSARPARPESARPSLPAQEVRPDLSVCACLASADRLSN